MATFVSYGQFLTTFSAACSQYAATVCGRHSLQEAVFVTTLALGRLECTFHCLISIYYALHRAGLCQKSVQRYNNFLK